MRVVLQRVKEASISIDGAPAQSIGPGLVLLFGVREGDTPDLIPKLAKKCANMRIFSDDEGRMNLSAVQLGYSALAASNFTLYANTDKGMRPSFTRAAAPELAEPMWEQFAAELEQQGLKEVVRGRFGADMKISLVNDGPVTLVVDTDDWGH